MEENAVAKASGVMNCCWPFLAVSPLSRVSCRESQWRPFPAGVTPDAETAGCAAVLLGVGLGLVAFVCGLAVHA